MSTFYSAFAPLSFTVLGLWFVVVQTRHREWSASPYHRRQASAVSLQLAIPGLMSLLSLVDPGSSTMWRVSFTVSSLAGVCGLVALAVMRSPRRRIGLADVGRIVAVALFVGVGVVALFPRVIHGVGISAMPLQVEAVILSLLVFLGMAVAWMLMFDDVEA